MLRHGFPPFLECSSKGDKRLSAFYARIFNRGNRTIEEIYQAAKVFEDGTTNLSINAAKGRQAVNMPELTLLYSQLWDEYFQENVELLQVINKYEGFSDIFGQAGHQCQATEIYRIWIKFQLKNLARNMEDYKHLIVNKHKTNEFNTYCGRGSIFGNEYSHLPTSSAKHKVNTVEQAIAHHRFSLVVRCNIDPVFKERVKGLKGKTLACYCSMPNNQNPCHCYTLAGASVAYSD